MRKAQSLLPYDLEPMMPGARQFSNFRTDAIRLLNVQGAPLMNTKNENWITFQKGRNLLRRLEMKRYSIRRDFYPLYPY